MVTAEESRKYNWLMYEKYPFKSRFSYYNFITRKLKESVQFIATHYSLVKVSRAA